MRETGSNHWGRKTPLNGWIARRHPRPASAVLITRYRPRHLPALVAGRCGNRDTVNQQFDQRSIDRRDRCLFPPAIAAGACGHEVPFRERSSAIRGDGLQKLNRRFNAADISDTPRSNASWLSAMMAIPRRGRKHCCLFVAGVNPFSGINHRRFAKT